jgi:nucleotide-binding universal stress UspA family protein
MQMTDSSENRIVVGVDGSDSSEQALRWAAYIAARSNAHVEAIITWPAMSDWSASWAPVDASWDPVGGAEQALENTLVNVFGEAVPPSLVRSVRQGGAAKVLLEASTGARMLVVGSRGHGGFTGLLLGSVSTACVEHATCPVLVVHGTTPPPE